MDSSSTPTALPPPKPQREDYGDQGGLAGTIKFFRETLLELKLISWPSRSQVIQETWHVLVLVAVITVAVMGFDLAVGKVIFEPLDKWAKSMGGGVGGGSGVVLPNPGENAPAPAGQVPAGQAPTGQAPAPSAPAAPAPSEPKSSPISSPQPSNK